MSAVLLGDLLVGASVVGTGYVVVRALALIHEYRVRSWCHHRAEQLRQGYRHTTD
jgi:hypothetical protein